MRIALAAVALPVLLVVTPTAQAPATAPVLIDAGALMRTVQTLAGPEYEGRAAGSAGGIKARAYVRERMTAAGLEPMGGSFEQPFAFERKSQATGAAGPTTVHAANVVGLCPGTDRNLPFIVVSAHYDHVGVREGTIYPGADDNASGVAVLLEIASVCTRQPFRHGLIIAAFDAEEMGLQGARAFLATPPVPRVRLALNVNLDMVARGDKGELFASGTSHSPALRTVLEPVAPRAGLTRRFGHDTPGSGHDDWTNQSDHGVFHAAGIPFVYFGVEDHPDYHQPGDTADKINPAFFATAAETILDAIRALDAGMQ